MHKDAERLARYICEVSPDACSGGEMFEKRALVTALQMSPEDLELAVDELKECGMLRVESPSSLMAEPELFRTFDAEVKGWDTSDDALTLARKLVEGGRPNYRSSELAETLGWPARRMNPASEELHRSGKVDVRQFHGSRPFTYGNLIPTLSTQRLVRDSR